MPFEPRGGFPPLIRLQENVEEKTLETRGFATTNIVNIANIMDTKKKEELFFAFGSDEEETGHPLVRNILDTDPLDYQNNGYDRFFRRTK